MANKTRKTTNKRIAPRAGAAEKPAAKAAKKTARKTAKKEAKPAKPAKRSHLEVRWIREWERQGGPELIEEFMFHPTRRWRSDFAHLESKLLIEIEGGAFGGRHTRGKGFLEDLDKYASAWLHGFTVLRIGAHQVRGDIIRAVIGRIAGNSTESCEAAGNSTESCDNSTESCAGEPGGSGEGAPGAALWRACGHAGALPGWLGGLGLE